MPAFVSACERSPGSGRFGYRRPHVLLKREGYLLNLGGQGQEGSLAPLGLWSLLVRLMLSSPAMPMEIKANRIS
jgi:hypothetical protein